MDINEILVVIDMQNDFLTGTLGSEEAANIIPSVLQTVKKFEGEIIFTRDTHDKHYLSTQEGRILPIPHCRKKTNGWKIELSLRPFATNIVDKSSFGSLKLAKFLKKQNEIEKIDRITIVGMCTDICIISNAIILKAALPETEIVVDSSCCAGTTPENHEKALTSMKMCQIKIIP